MENMRVQVENERAFEFESAANEFFAQMNPTMEKQGNFWTTFSFEVATDQEMEKVSRFHAKFEEDKN